MSWTFDELVDDVRDMIDDPRERFDEDDDPLREPPPEFWGCCGNCDEFTRCRIEGHEEIGWCSCDSDFHRVDDPDECD